MARLSEGRIQQLIDRFEEVEARMSVASDTREIVRLSKEHAELRPVAEMARTVLSMRAQLSETEAMLQDPEADRELVDLAYEEVGDLRNRLPGLEREMQLMLAPKDADDEASAVLEVRAGTGGDEAALFAEWWRPPGLSWSVAP